MSKCDWCQHSRLKDGKLHCPFSCCVLPNYKIEEILKKVGGRG